MSGALQNVTILLDHGADIEAVGKPGRETPVLTATSWNKPLMVELLLKRGAKMKTREDGKNIVHLTAAHCDATFSTSYCRSVSQA